MEFKQMNRPFEIQPRPAALGGCWRLRPLWLVTLVESELSALAGHANAKTTGLYDRRNDDINVGEI
jgi:hypothetical protein